MQAAKARSSTIRVLHVSSGNLYGGVETLLVTLARYRNLCPSMEPHFALSFEGRLSGELRAEGVPVTLLGNVRTSRPWTVLKARKRLQELLRRENYDAVVCHMAWPMAIFGTVASRMGRRLAFWTHDVPDGRHWLDRWARLTTPDVVLVNSKFTDASAPKLYPNVPRGVVYYPVAPRKLENADDHRAQVRRELAVPDGTTVIIQVSRMEPWKGHELHLRALGNLKDLSAPWVCWMAGGPQRPEEQTYLQGLKETAKNLGIADRVKFLGQRSDVPKLLAAADIFCQPNRNPEPFGIVFIEALGAGLPIVANALGAAPEIVDEHCGVLAPPNDPVALASLLRRFIESPELRQAAGQHGPARASELCDPAAQLERIGQLLAVSNGTEFSPALPAGLMTVGTKQ